MSTKKIQVLGSFGQPDAVLCSEQVLTDAQKAQARANIGAVSREEVEASIGGEGAAIIDVIGLPTENINFGAFYRLFSVNWAQNGAIYDSKVSVTHVDILPDEGVQGIDFSTNQCYLYCTTTDGQVYMYVTTEMAMIASESGISIPVGWQTFNNLYECGAGFLEDKAVICVTTLPDQGLPALDVRYSGMCLYYNMADSIVYAYIDNALSEVISAEFGMTVPAGWHPFENFTGLLGINYGGVISNIDDSEENTLYILKSYDLYAYNNKWEPIIKESSVIQSDWEQNDATQPDYIRNKPNIVQADWNIYDETNPAAIKNRPFGDIPAGAIVYDGQVNCKATDYGSVYVVQGNCGKLELIDGASYVVNCNGVINNVIARDGVLNFDGDSYIVDSGQMVNVPGSVGGVNDIQIQLEFDAIRTIDTKYLPSSLGIGKTGVGTYGEIFNDYTFNIADGGYAHAEGNGTAASGHASHTEGSYTKASGHSAHAEGGNTTASGNYQHVQGKYNIEDVNNTYAHIVGNGTPTQFSNAHTIDWDGNAWYAGAVESKGIIIDDGSGNKTQLAVIAEPTAADNGKFLQVVSGKWAAVSISYAEDGEF